MRIAGRRYRGSIRVGPPGAPVRRASAEHIRHCSTFVAAKGPPDLFPPGVSNGQGAVMCALASPRAGRFVHGGLA